MDSIEKLKENLNEQQLEAVTETEGFVRVIAGAGSGKTKALTQRYAYIIEALGINSSNILCVTFTNKAAQEMRKRVKRLVGENSDLSYITTYHGFCVRVLREDINKIKYPKNFIIMDVEDQKTVLRSIYNDLGITSKIFTFKQSLAYINRAKNSLEYLAYVLESKKSDSENIAEKIFRKYLEKQQRNFALDFADLINYTIYIFSNNPDILSKWQKRLHYIQVDETQDSSEKQFHLIEMLSQFHKNLFVVGDPDQTIYEWRGAKPEILVDFDKQFVDSKTIIMNQNYRSTPNILSLGNHIIKNNKIRVDKDMFTQNPKGVEVVHFHGQNDYEEGLWVANEIKRLVAEGTCKYSDFAILYRAHYISRSIEQSLIRENVPYSVFGGIRFFERKEIKDILAYLRLIEFGDDFSFLRVVNAPSRGLGKKFIQIVAKIAEKENISLYNALKENISQKDLSRKGAIEFIELIEKFKKIKADLIISDLVKEIMDESGLSAYYRTDGDTNRLENIKELQNSIILLETQDEESVSLTEYLQEIALYTNMDLEDDGNDRVKLMTIHTSKGLEFPYVFLCGFTEGVLPSAMSLKERRAKALEEERRLTYVAITRAEKAFYMTESEGFNFSLGLNKYPSRFLFEISDNYFVRKGELPQELIDEAKEQLKLNANRQLIQKNFEVGDLVNHPVWNEGKIIKVNEEKGEYQVEFSEIGKIKPINFEFKGLSNSKNSKQTSVRSNYYSTERNAINFMASVKDQEIKKIAMKKHPNDYYAQKQFYKTQISCKKEMSNVPNYKSKELAINKFPKDYYKQLEQLERNRMIFGISDLKSNDKDVRLGAKEYFELKEIMESLQDSEIKRQLIKEYPLDIFKQYREYEDRTKAYLKQAKEKEFMDNLPDSPVKMEVIEEWPNNYSMQIEELEAKEFMEHVTDNQLKTKAIEEWPNNYYMQKTMYEKLISKKDKHKNSSKEPIDFEQKKKQITKRISELKKEIAKQERIKYGSVFKDSIKEAERIEKEREKINKTHRGYVKSMYYNGPENIEKLDDLINKGYDVSDSIYPIIRLIERGRTTEFIQFLIEKGMKINNNDIKSLKENGFFNSVEFLNIAYNAEQIDNDALNQILKIDESIASKNNQPKADNDMTPSPTTYKSNNGNNIKTKEKDKNGLWSKLKGWWS